MKRLLTTLFCICAVTMFCVAQSKADAFKVQNPAQAAQLSTVLGTELKLTAEQQARVNDLLASTLTAQAEVMNTDKSAAAKADNDEVMARHAMHFEGNLKAIIGEEKF